MRANVITSTETWRCSKPEEGEHKLDKINKTISHANERDVLFALKKLLLLILYPSIFFVVVTQSGEIRVL